jgi:hypothetical protein
LLARPRFANAKSARCKYRAAKSNEGDVSGVEKLQLWIASS